MGKIGVSEWGGESRGRRRDCRGYSLRFGGRVMLTVAVLIGLMAVGMLVGYYAPKGAGLRRAVGTVVSVLVYLLLFTLGVELGVNEELIADLGTLGMRSLFIAVLCMGGSVVMAWAFGRLLHCGAVESQTERASLGKALLGSVSYLGVFALGVLVGVLLGGRPGLMERFDMASFLLYGLMLAVGFSVGGDRASLATIRHLSPKLLLLPLATMVGTLVGSMVVYVSFRDFTVGECNAIGAGYGYYSLSSVLIGETVKPALRGAMLGSVALMSNICREVLSILLAGPIARCFGPLAPVCAAGATSMDTTLPFVVRASGKEYAVVSVYHGVTMSVLCPVLIGLFLQL